MKNDETYIKCKAVISGIKKDYTEKFLSAETTKPASVTKSESMTV